MISSLKITTILSVLVYPPPGRSSKFGNRIFISYVALSTGSPRCSIIDAKESLIGSNRIMRVMSGSI
jgi:hypothetical protein